PPPHSGWPRLAEAHHAGRLQTELTRLGRYPLIVIDLCRHRDYAEVRPSSAVTRVTTAGFLVVRPLLVSG
ncbi:MAG: hypothetical protein ACRDST_17590, partial [Pseudonocardiaceae bacterium]